MSASAAEECVSGLAGSAVTIVSLLVSCRWRRSVAVSTCALSPPSVGASDLRGGGSGSGGGGGVDCVVVAVGCESVLVPMATVSRGLNFCSVTSTAAASDVLGGGGGGGGSSNGGGYGVSSGSAVRAGTGGVGSGGGGVDSGLCVVAAVGGDGQSQSRRVLCHRHRWEHQT